MRRILGIFGVGVLLLIVNCEASTNKKNFWKLPWGSYDKSPSAGSDPASGSDDLTFDDNTEGSGHDEDDKVTPGGTHEDDEDFDGGSGDNIIELTPDDDDDDNKDDKDDDYYTFDDNKDNTVMPTDDEDDDDDYDLLDGSGSGDASIVEDVIEPEETGNFESEKPTTPKKQLTACQNLQKSAMMATSSFMPDCNEMGEFELVQCMNDAGSGKQHCWCVDPRGIEILGTKMAHPHVPDCLYGENLTPCVKSLVKNSQVMLLGSFKPQCTDEGEYETIQCHGSDCWCVDAKGNEVVGTVTQKPTMPDCSPVTDVKVLDPIRPEKTPNMPKADDGYTVSGNSNEDIDNVIVNIGAPDLPDEDIDMEEENNAVGGNSYATIKQQKGIMQQPGLLAAIIGGAVVGLLCMVLLVMFIVYRMRKKDEGSYPLDEQKYQNYSYTKAPDKEFYA